MGGDTYVAIGSGDYFTCALAADGAAWCAGQNYYGELGNGTTAFSPVPTAVAGGLRFTELGAGDSFACGIATDGLTYCWGRNDYRQLGDLEAGSQSLFPVAVAGGHRFSSISVGARHVCGLESDGTAYCWGDGSYGKLGTDPAVLSQPVPAAVTGGRRFRSISAGGYHTCGIAYDDYTYCWGSNLNGEIGDGSTGTQLTPALVAPPAL
jgi:alpha-tubulin suppressor-like RCC1 family protein